MKDNNRKTVKEGKSKYSEMAKYLGNLFTVLAGLIGALAMNRGHIEKTFDDYIAKPTLVFIEDAGQDIYKSDIELKDGVLKLYPLLVVMEEGHVVYKFALELPVYFKE